MHCFCLYDNWFTIQYQNIGILHYIFWNYNFLNLARISHRTVHTWFQKIDPVWIIGMHVSVCVSMTEAIYN